MPDGTPISQLKRLHISQSNDFVSAPPLKSFDVLVVMSLGHNLKAHSDADNAFVPGTTKHPEARLELNTFINPSVADKQIPRLMWMLLGCIRVHIRHCAASTPRHDINVHRISVTASEGGEQ